MRIRKVPLILLLTIGAATSAFGGQFDSMYAVQSRLSSTDLLQVWKDKFPGLYEKIIDASNQAHDTGNYYLTGIQTPVAWSVTASNDVVVNSINAGYFVNLRGPDYQPLFPGLTASNQGVTVDAGNDLIVMPNATSVGGFGYGISADSGTEVNVTAGNRIILMTAADKGNYVHFDGTSIFSGESAKVNLNASEIYIYGSVIQNPYSLVDLSATKGVYLVTPTNGEVLGDETVNLMLADMEIDAPTVLLERTGSLGRLLFGSEHPGNVFIGLDN